MNDLPHELIDEICSLLPREDLKNVFMLSHQFQSSAEKYSGFFEKYTLDTDIDSRYTALPEELNHWLITLGRILLTLGCPTYFYFDEHRLVRHEFKLDLRVLIDLAMKFPNLEYLGIRTGGFEWCETLYGHLEDPVKYYYSDWAGPRRDARNDFAAAVSSLHNQLPKLLRWACLNFLNPLKHAFVGIDHNEPLVNLFEPSFARPSPPSTSATMYDRREHFLAEGGTAPIWPKLEKLEVVFHIARPDGTWYFQRMLGKGSDSVGYLVTQASYSPYEVTELDERMESLINDTNYDDLHYRYNQFRFAPYDRLSPLLEGFTKATLRMKYFKEAVIWCPLICNDEYTKDYFPWREHQVNPKL
ncbi:hypothetical protein COCSADRAFT_352877 [Bipolaris sorokiniana ND90Pr]|uniref:F-box domain-containing protein n=1 Tax=Cochliobolus sativus (strain ND90Pr / ATCC 201652) TaxID=665912 RepID=M2TF36_COCSN|nr:uncharacterized protein COCSADRAFT_352877 [Bipolaris sorokiniana ND90Pr]EMD67851.1 hypothetical protein COCSADRAFT_352877 [Bipolaris sorokiniana ND90Pr]